MKPSVNAETTNSLCHGRLGWEKPRGDPMGFFRFATCPNRAQQTAASIGRVTGAAVPRRLGIIAAESIKIAGARNSTFSVAKFMMRGAARPSEVILHRPAVFHRGGLA